MRHLPSICMVVATAVVVDAAINRHAVVRRHNLTFTAATGNALSNTDALTIGNGAFAINVDATGLQTLGASAFDLNTLSDFCWHSSPAAPGMDGGDCVMNANENQIATLSCGAGSTITNVTFASYGLPSGSCGNFALGSCNALNSTTIVSALCLGKMNCSITPSNGLFGDPCLDTTKHFDAAVTCSKGPNPSKPHGNAALEAYNYTWFKSHISATQTVDRPFATDNNISGSYRDWPMSNPHRVGMGQLQLRMLGTTADPPAIPPASVLNISAELNTWAGGVTSTFTLVDVPSHYFDVAVNTSVHPDIDLVATSVACTARDGAAGGCPVALRLAFGYPTGNWGPSANDFNPSFDYLHTTTAIINNSDASLTVMRTADDTAYTVYCQWSDKAWTAVRTGAHALVLQPPKDAPSTTVALSCLWAPQEFVYPIGMTSSEYVAGKAAASAALVAPGAGRFPLYGTVQSASAAMWGAFWIGGSFLDLSSATKDGRAFELERRIVLSRFLTRSNSAGASPPQETGLLSNSWSGKFHLEMRFWHAAHWPFWGNPELLDRSSGFYFDLLPNATSLARFQGYKGARWLKMLGLANTHNASTSIDVPWLGTKYTPPPDWAPTGSLLLWESFNLINPVLQWNQPHMIFLADAQRRAVNASSGPVAALAAMQALSPLVFATATYLADVPFFNETSGFYEMGPPLLGGEEYGDFTVISRTTFETVYFAWALDIANDWRVLLGLSPDAQWATVASGMSNIPLDPAESVPVYSFNAEAACCYMPAAKCPSGRFGGRTQCSPLSGHPMPAGVLGMVNGRAHGDRYGVRVDAANATIARILDGWAPGWGWDYPLVALAMTRMTWDPSSIVDYLLATGTQNLYIKTGYNYNGDFAYLPGNGGLLLTAAMMAAGTDSSPRNYFPAAWAIQAEGFAVPYM